LGNVATGSDNFGGLIAVEDEPPAFGRARWLREVGLLTEIGSFLVKACGVEDRGVVALPGYFFPSIMEKAAERKRRVLDMELATFGLFAGRGKEAASE